MKKNILGLLIVSLPVLANAASYFCETDGIINGKKAVTECKYLSVPSSLVADRNCFSWGKLLKLKSERPLSHLIMSSAFVDDNSNQPSPQTAKEKCEWNRMTTVIAPYDQSDDMTKTELRLGRFDTIIYKRD